MSSSYQSPGGPGCLPECFIDRYAPTMWVEADRARRAHEAHAAQPRDAFIADAKATAARAGLTIPERAAYVAARVAHFDAQEG